MEHICYVLYSKKYNKIYVGYTSSLIERIRSHNSENNKGYTKTFQPWIVAHLEVFQRKREALIREKQLKSSRGRFQIWEEIIPWLVGLLSVRQLTD